jgi:hypothetical protein
MDGPKLESVAFSPAAKAELEVVRARARELEAQLQERGVAPEHVPAAATQKAVNETWGAAVATTPQHTPLLPTPEAVVLQLTPEQHDAFMGDLLGVLQTKGVAAAIVQAEASKNPHLIDDFHRVLVEWVHEGQPAKGADSREFAVALSMVLYEVTLPKAAAGTDSAQQDTTKVVHDFIALMEGVYRGMLQMQATPGEYFSFEIANPVGSTHTSVYIAVPQARMALFEKQVSSMFPQARLAKCNNDYNPFAEGAVIAAAQARLADAEPYSLRVYELFQHDPLDVLLNGFSQLDSISEGAAVQFVVSPRDLGLVSSYRKALEKARSGVPLHKALTIKDGIASDIAKGFGEFFFNEVEETIEDSKRPAADDPRFKNIERKISSPIVKVDIRIVASAQTNPRAKAILEDIEAAFKQYDDTNGNRMVWDMVDERKVQKFAHAFSYRLLDEKLALSLSLTELASMAHLPRAGSGAAAPDLKQDKGQAAAAPQNIASEGVLLGTNTFRGVETPVYVGAEDRLRHMYLIGQTGTGKSALLKNMVIQDIKSGAGVCFIDPHGTDVMDILSAIPPERQKDVIYFDPAYTARPMGLNMLEYDTTRPEQKTLVVDELFGIFKKLFGAIPESMGPAFEQYFRNSALLVMEDPESGNTLLDISRIFADTEFRLRKLAACKNPIVKQFWEGIASQATGDQGLENYAPYVTSKFDVFTTNEIVRPIISQQTSSFNFRDIMDNRKILLVNLSKGRIGDLNANLLGLIIVGKFLIAALSRADSFGKDFPQFYLHIDEFQNFATPSIATILSEARKYKLSLTVAHQFIAQLTDEIRNAVFGNVGSMCAFRIGADDGEALQKQFAPTFSAQDLMQIDNYNAHVRLLVKGQPAAPFNMHTLPFTSGTVEQAMVLQNQSYETYGRPRAEVEADLMRRMVKTPQNPATLA